MRRRMMISVCFLLAVTLRAEHACDAGIVFEALKSRNLPSNYVKCLYQDSEGFIWIATDNGLARFDGTDMVSYNKYIDRNSFFIYKVVQDTDGNLLLGTDKGLFAFNKISRILSVIIEDITASAIVRDAGGNVWVGGTEGLFLRREGMSEFSKVEIITEPVIDLCAGLDGDIWMTTWHKGLYVYNPSDRTMQVFDTGSLKHAYVIHRDSEDGMWIGTWGAGLLKLSKDFKDSSDYETFSSDTGTDTVLDDIIYAINDVDQWVMVGGQKGLSVINRNTGEISFYVPDDRKGALPYNQVNSILVTSNSNVYLGLYGGGVCKVSTQMPPYTIDRLPAVESRFNTKTIHSIYRSPGGSFWMGISDHGFIRYDALTGNALKHNELSAFKDMLSISTVVSVCERNSSCELCFGTYSEGLWVYNPESDTVKVYSTHTCNAMKTNTILAMENDSYGNVWVGTNKGVFVLDTADRITALDGLEDRIASVSSSEDGKVYIATSSHGVVEAGMGGGGYPDLLRYIPVERKNQLVNLLVDMEGNVWGGGHNGGLYLYDKEISEFRSCNPLHNIRSQTVSNLLQLSDGEIYLTVPDALLAFRYDVNDMSMDITKYINIQDVVFCNNTALFFDGELLFGTTEGVLRIPTVNEKRYRQAHKHTLAFTDFLVNGISFRESDIIADDIDYVNKIKVRKGDNVEIRYRLLDYDNCSVPLYKCSYADLCEYTTDESVTFKVDRRRTRIMITHDASGQCRIIYVVAEPEWFYIVMAVVIVLFFVAFLYFGHSEREMSFHPVTDRGYDRISFEINSPRMESSDETLLTRAMEIIEAHISDADYKQSDFIKDMGVSRTSLTEKLKELTGYTPVALIMEVRLKTAYATIMSATDKLRISEVAYSVGFNDAKYFSTCFRKRYGITPKELMNQRLETL